MGRVISDLLAEALAARRRRNTGEPASFAWVARPMAARVDIDDTEALYRVLDRGHDG